MIIFASQVTVRINQQFQESLRPPIGGLRASQSTTGPSARESLGSAGLGYDAPWTLIRMQNRFQCRNWSPLLVVMACGRLYESSDTSTEEPIRGRVIPIAQNDSFELDKEMLLERLSLLWGLVLTLFVFPDLVSD